MTKNNNFMIRDIVLKKMLLFITGSPFACPQDPQDKVQVQSHQSGQHLFSFPPTPPKDSTPDSVQTGPTEYQVIRNIAKYATRSCFY